MRSTRSAKALLVVAALSVLVAVPAAAAETLALTCTVCTQVIATGSGLPTNEVVHLTLHDVTTGQEVVKPVPVRTDAQGKFLTKVNVDLTRHPSLESSVWKSDGQVLVIAAHNRFDSPCKPKPADKLAFTGSHTSQLLGGGVGLLVVGLLLVVGASRRRAAA